MLSLMTPKVNAPNDLMTLGVISFAVISLVSKKKIQKFAVNTIDEK